MIVSALYGAIMGLFALFSTEPPTWAKIVLSILVIIALLIAYVLDLYRQFKINELEKRIRYLEDKNDEKETCTRN